MNLADIFVILIVLVFSVVFYRKGFIKACFSFIPTLISIFTTYKIYPFFSKFMRTTKYFDSLKDSILNSSWLNNVIFEKSNESQSTIINNMPIPDFLKDSLISNNNNVVYDILNVTNIKEYIAGYIANVLMNILTMIIVFIVISIACKVIFNILNLFSKLPVLSYINKLAGLAVGLIQSTLIIWIIGIGLTYFYYDPKFSSVFELINTSFIAKYFYQNNYLLFMILKIFS